jgi:hypothetical protein
MKLLHNRILENIIFEFILHQFSKIYLLKFNYNYKFIFDFKKTILNLLSSFKCLIHFNFLSFDIFIYKYLIYLQIILN